MSDPRFFASADNLPDYMQAIARKFKMSVWEVAELYYQQQGDSSLFTVIFEEGM